MAKKKKIKKDGKLKKKGIQKTVVGRVVEVFNDLTDTVKVKLDFGDK